MIIKAIAAAVGAAAMVVGTAASMSHQSKMRKAQKQASKFERQKNELQSMRQRVDAIRTARAAQAEVQQVAENQGVAGSSAAAGGQGSIISQMTGNLSFLDQYGFLSDQAGAALQKAADHNTSASMWGQVASLGGQIFGAVGGTGAFKGPTPPAAPPTMLP